MIGKHIWFLRIRDGLTLEEVSEKSGVRPEIIREFEDSNITHIPNADLAAIAKAFKFENAIRYFDFLKLNGHQRQFRLYTLGLPKTGTVSLFALFGNYRSGHEFWQWDTNQKYLLYKEGEITREAFRDFLILRDAAACLEMDSAYFNRCYIDLLASEFPDARFICLYRDPRSWVRSQVNYFMDIRKEALQSDRNDNGFPFDLPRGDQSSRDRFIKNMGIYLETTFECWAKAYRMILDQTNLLSPERYCYIETSGISQNLGMFSKLSGIPEKNLIREKSHSNRSVYTVDVANLVDEALITEYYNRHCKVLSDRLVEKI